MALSKIDVVNMLTGEVPNANVATLGVAKGGTGLTSGTTNQFLKFTGSTTLASAADNTGKLGQIITAATTTATTVSSNTYADTNITASITPSATNSKILIFITDNCQVVHNSSNNDNGMAFRIKRTIGGSDTTLDTDDQPYQGFYQSASAGENFRQHISLHSVDSSHNTTNAITYTHQIASYRTSGGALGASAHDNNRGNITLIEVLA
jgi:hypothetical protein|tara:strand:+ start:12 stop:635 length:624 start_codon:yes stop_codon:yes gene_type:complete